ncbi:palmitoyl-(protein) hydrolase [Aureococcus anophagefferens]|nr:palmitoyl-(protein) hydrolase [Aureococcus anophagefferens]
MPGLALTTVWVPETTPQLLYCSAGSRSLDSPTAAVETTSAGCDAAMCYAARRETGGLSTRRWTFGPPQKNVTSDRGPRWRVCCYRDARVAIGMVAQDRFGQSQLRSFAERIAEIVAPVVDECAASAAHANAALAILAREVERCNDRAWATSPPRPLAARRAAAALGKRAAPGTPWPSTATTAATCSARSARRSSRGPATATRRRALASRRLRRDAADGRRVLRMQPPTGGDEVKAFALRALFDERASDEGLLDEAGFLRLNLPNDDVGDPDLVDAVVLRFETPSATCSWWSALSASRREAKTESRGALAKLSELSTLKTDDAMSYIVGGAWYNKMANFLPLGGAGNARKSSIIRARDVDRRGGDDFDADPVPELGDSLPERAFSVAGPEVKAAYQSLLKVIIRPPRATYDERRLGVADFAIKTEATTHRTFGTLKSSVTVVHREDLSVPNERGLEVRASLWTPRTVGVDYDRLGPGGHRPPCVVYVHGNACNRLGALSLLRPLCLGGIALCAVDCAGSGNSGGEFVRAAEGDGDSPAPRNFVAGAVTEAALALVRSSVKHRAGFDVYDVAPIEHVANMRHSATPALFVHGKLDDFINCQHSVDLHESHGGDASLLLLDVDHQANRPASALIQSCLFLYDRLLPTDDAAEARAKYVAHLDKLADQGHLGATDASAAEASGLSRDRQRAVEDAVAACVAGRQRQGACSANPY